MGMGQFRLGAISGLLVGLLTDGTAARHGGADAAGLLGMVIAERSGRANSRRHRQKVLANDA